MYVPMDPRFETPAEIKMFEILGGDLVGMTSVPETVLAREAQLCYSSIAMVTNWAAGISPTPPLTHQEVVDIMEANGEKLRSLIMATIEELPEERGCGCAAAGVEIPWLMNTRRPIGASMGGVEHRECMLQLCAMRALHRKGAPR